jgi:uncharacterized protein
MADRNNNNDGRGNFGNPEQHAEAGRKGGEATASSHDRSFYEEIGSEGGQASSGSFEKGSERAREAGRKGGQNSNSGGNTQNDR